MQATHLDTKIPRKFGPEVLPDEDVTIGVVEVFILGMLVGGSPDAHIRDTQST